MAAQSCSRWPHHPAAGRACAQVGRLQRQAGCGFPGHAARKALWRGAFRPPPPRGRPWTGLRGASPAWTAGVSAIPASARLRLAARPAALRPGGAPCGACPPASPGGTRVRCACLRQAGATRPSPRFARLRLRVGKPTLRSRSRLLASGLRPAARDGFDCAARAPGKPGGKRPCGDARLRWRFASLARRAGQAPRQGRAAWGRRRLGSLRSLGDPSGDRRLPPRQAVRAGARSVPPGCGRACALAPCSPLARSPAARGIGGTAPLRAAGAALRGFALPCGASVLLALASRLRASLALRAPASLARCAASPCMSSVPSASRRGRPGAACGPRRGDGSAFRGRAALSRGAPSEPPRALRGLGSQGKPSRQPARSAGRGLCFARPLWHAVLQLAAPSGPAASRRGVRRLRRADQPTKGGHP